MKFQNLKNKAKYALATVAVSALSAPALADTNLLDTASTEIGALKTGIIAFGAVADKDKVYRGRPDVYGRNPPVADSWFGRCDCNYFRCKTRNQ